MPDRYKEQKLKPTLHDFKKKFERTFPSPLDPNESLFYISQIDPELALELEDNMNKRQNIQEQTRTLEEHLISAARRTGIRTFSRLRRPSPDKHISTGRVSVSRGKHRILEYSHSPPQTSRLTKVS